MRFIVLFWMLTFHIPAFGQEMFLAVRQDKYQLSLHNNRFTKKAENIGGIKPVKLSKPMVNSLANRRLLNSSFSYLLKSVHQPIRMLPYFDSRTLVPCWNCYRPRITSSNTRINKLMELNGVALKEVLKSTNSIYIMLSQRLAAANLSYIMELTSNESDSPFGFSIIYTKHTP